MPSIMKWLWTKGCMEEGTWLWYTKYNFSTQKGHPWQHIYVEVRALIVYILLRLQSLIYKGKANANYTQLQVEKKLIVHNIQVPHKNDSSFFLS